MTGANVAEQALALARIEVAGSPDERKRVAAWDRLCALLSTLDSKTSVLLRFNAIVVAALAYVAIIRGVDPLMGPNAMLVSIAAWIAHASLVVSAASCGFAFPVINVEWKSPGGQLEPVAGGALTLDDAALQRLAALVTRRTLLYAWSWRLSVVGGVGFAILVALAIFH